MQGGRRELLDSESDEAGPVDIGLSKVPEEITHAVHVVTDQQLSRR
jgi:hypothetical protein